MFNDEQFPSGLLQGTRPVLKYAAACILAVMPLCSATAGEEEIKGERQYRQAVEMLEPLDGMVMAMFNASRAGSPPEELDERAAAISRLVAPAGEMLQEASRFDHPIAQYRLALLHMSLMQGTEDTCTLLNESADHGFAPAAVLLAVECVPFETTARHMAQLKKAPTEITRYTAYYPQPTVDLRCIPKRDEGLLLQLGQKEDYLAEIYKLLAERSGRNTPERTQYLKQAVAANGCIYAARRLERRRP
ncbi:MULTISPECIES: hypothetical protein [Pseudomonas]|uniref:Sel1 repeat family protein n=1 Tax=Pseudomonas fulva TaxID=47880 RepID=A0A0D0KWL3_9PSED|nr:MULTISPECIES: hypothetical protein [Pseudomonas]KIQ04359.1 hypothetical protein RU08_05290 [Pseudomonas fulva]